MVKTGKVWRCLDCSMQRAVDAMRGMANKTGEAYDRWRSSAGPQGRPPESSEER